MLNVVKIGKQIERKPRKITLSKIPVWEIKLSPSPLCLIVYSVLFDPVDVSGTYVGRDIRVGMT